MHKRSDVVTIARKMVRSKGLINLSRLELCDKSGIPDGSFHHVMGCSFAQFIKELQAENIKQPMAPVSKRRVPAEMRKEHILAVAVDQAKKMGYHKITRDAVADAAGVSFGSVNRYFGTMTQLRGDVMRSAIKQGIAEIVAQGLANGDERAKKAPMELKLKAAELLANA